METQMMKTKTNQLKKAAFKKREADLQKWTLEFIKEEGERQRKLEELHFLKVELENDECCGAERDEEENRNIYDSDYSHFTEDDDNRYGSIEIVEHDLKENPELPEMEMEMEMEHPSPSVVEIKKDFQNKDILITEEEVECYLKKSIFHFPKAPMLYANGVALQKKPLAKDGYSVKFKFTLTPNVPVVRRRSLVFGKNPKTKKRLSMPGAYILLDETKNIVGYEFDKNFHGEPDSKKIHEYHWDFRGFEYETAFLEKPTEYMTELLVHRLLRQGYVYFPSRPHMKTMTLSNLTQFRSKIREDGLIKVKDLIPEDGSNQTYIFTQPGLIYNLPCLSEWEEQDLLLTAEPTLKIVVAKDQADDFKIIGYRIEQPQDGTHEDVFTDDDSDIDDIDDSDEDSDIEDSDEDSEKKMSCETNWADILDELKCDEKIARENSVEHPDSDERALGLRVSSELTKAIELLHLVKEDISNRYKNRKDEENYDNSVVEYDIVFKNQTLFTVTSFYSIDRYPRSENTFGQSTDCQFYEEYYQLKRRLLGI
jgi:hypothetical protein